MSRSLSLLYCLAWGIAAFNPGLGFALLAGSAMLVTFGYFLFTALRIILRGPLVTGVLVLLGLFFPPSLVLVPIWALWCVGMKLVRFLANIPLILAGLVLYAALLIPMAGSSLLDGPWWTTLLASVAFAVAGGCLLRLFVVFFEGQGYPAKRALAVMLGFVSYLFIFLLLLLIPSVEGDDDMD